MILTQKETSAFEKHPALEVPWLSLLKAAFSYHLKLVEKALKKLDAVDLGDEHASQEREVFRCARAAFCLVAEEQGIRGADSIGVYDIVKAYIAAYR